MKPFHARLHRLRGGATLVGSLVAVLPLVAAAQVPPEASQAAPEPSEVDVDDAASPEVVKPSPDDRLPFDRVSSSQLEAQAGSASRPLAPSRPARFMRPEGVEDPFPDHGVQVRPHNAGVLLGLGLGAATASVVMARFTLLPDCGDENDLTTCTAPNRGDIGLRSGRLFGTVAFGVGGAALGAFGGRELGRYLKQGSTATLQRRRRTAVGIGSAAVVIGFAGIVVGSAVFAVGARRSLRLARSFESADVAGVGSEELARLDETIGHVRTARAGLMVLVAAPTFLATGISLLVNRPKRRVSVSPQLGRSRLGLTATVRF